MNKSKFITIIMASMFLLTTLLVGCQQKSTATSQSTSTATVTTQTIFTAPPSGTALTGAGATFPAPLYTKWFDAYDKLFGIQVNYQPIGSGGGIEQITSRTVDFGASDGIMSSVQQCLAEANGSPVLHIPLTSGAVAIVYNLPGIASDTLKLSGEALANIYLKKITKWNDPAIANLNPDIKLPDTQIAVVHRADGSGTTYIFTNYLSKISSDWNILVGSGMAVDWPGDIGGAQSAGVAGAVQQTPGAIGYIEMAYAQQSNLPWIKIQNSAGNWEEPSIAGTTSATEGINLPDDMKIMFTNSPNPDAYPICGYSWVLVYQNQTDKTKGTMLVNLLWWAIHDGQSAQYTQPLGYAPLSPAAVTKAENEILSIKYQGQPLLTR